MFSQATGANRGTGLNLLNAFVAESWDVTATVRPQTRRDADPSIADVSPPSSLDLTLRSISHLTHRGAIKLEKTGARILEIHCLDESTIEQAAIVYGIKPRSSNPSRLCPLSAALRAIELPRRSLCSRSTLDTPQTEKEQLTLLIS